MDEKDEHEETPQRGRLDLSVPQVAGSALAAVAAALLASQLGVYGTIIGAGVVSIVATAGGTLFQHFFRRTGEQIRTVSTRHLPVAVPGADPAARAGSTRTTAESPPGEGGGPGDDRSAGEYGEATVHGTTKRGWRKSAIGAVVVFVLAMGTVTSIELATGSEPSVTAVFDGGGSHGGSPSERPSDPASAPASDPAGTPGGTPSAEPSTTPSGSASPSPTPSDSGSASPTPDPSTPSSGGSPSTGTSTTPDPGHSPDDGKGGTGGSASPGAQD